MFLFLFPGKSFDPFFGFWCLTTCLDNRLRREIAGLKFLRAQISDGKVGFQNCKSKKWNRFDEADNTHRSCSSLNERPSFTSPPILSFLPQQEVPHFKSWCPPRVEIISNFFASILRFYLLWCFYDAKNTSFYSHKKALNRKAYYPVKKASRIKVLIAKVKRHALINFVVGSVARLSRDIC